MNNVHSFIRILLFCLFFVLLAVMVLYVTGVIYPVADESQSGELTDWMSNIDGATKISTINIPGTHDSGTKYIFPAYFLQDQDTSIKNQMNNGFRYFDIRVSLDKKNDDQLILIHSFGKCREGGSIYSSSLKYHDICSDAYQFLKEHPSETILFCVKAENDSDDLSVVEKLIEQEVNVVPDKWYVDNRIPTLDESRGRIILCRRYEGGYGLNFQWEDQGSAEVLDDPCETIFLNKAETLTVQDRYHYSAEDKWNAVMKSLENGKSEDHSINLVFLSASYGKLPHPRSFAKNMNTRFLEEPILPGDYGIIVFDFATEKLADKVIKLN